MSTVKTLKQGLKILDNPDEMRFFGLSPQFGYNGKLAIMSDVRFFMDGS